jgi:hypothetical protein
VLQYTLRRCGWARARLGTHWDARLANYRTGGTAVSGSGGSGGGGGSGGKAAAPAVADAGGAVDSGEAGVMLRVDVLKDAQPPSPWDFDAAAANSPKLVQVCMQTPPVDARSVRVRAVVRRADRQGTPGPLFVWALAAASPFFLHRVLPPNARSSSRSGFRS